MDYEMFQGNKQNGYKFKHSRKRDICDDKQIKFFKDLMDSITK